MIYYTILYYTILYYTTLYYSIISHVSPIPLSLSPPALTASFFVSGLGEPGRIRPVRLLRVWVSEGLTQANS